MSVRLDVDNAEARASRTVHESGNSTVVGIPRPLLDAAGFDVGDDVELVVSFDSGEIVLRRDEDVEAQQTN